MVRAAVTDGYLLKLHDVDKLSSRMPGIDEHRFWSVRYFQDVGTKTCIGFEPWRTAIMLISLANQAMTKTRENLSQQLKGRRGWVIDKSGARTNAAPARR